MRRILSSVYNLFPNNLNSTESTMRYNPAILILTFLFTLLTGCGLPVGYDPCYGGACDGSGSVQDPTPNDGEVSCADLAELAVLFCGAEEGSILDCQNDIIYCDTNGDGQANGDGQDIVVNVTVEDGDVTVTYDGDDSASSGSDGGGDSDNPECSDGEDNDGNGLVDFPQDPGCTSATDSNEYTSSGSGDCTETAGGIEYCDGVDNDCNGSIDDGDFDGDGYISDDCTEYDGLSPEGLLTGDCQDSGSYVGYMHSSLIHPGQTELGDWIDANCNGFEDDEANDGCVVLCDTDGDGDEEFEWDGDAAYECVSAFFIADHSSDYSAIDSSYSWSYDDGATATLYGNIGVTCDAAESSQGNPAGWSSISTIQSELCANTPALATVDCLALF